MQNCRSLHNDYHLTPDNETRGATLKTTPITMVTRKLMTMEDVRTEKPGFLPWEDDLQMVSKFMDRKVFSKYYEHKRSC